MKNVNNCRYNLQSLKSVNNLDDLEHGVKESDVEMVNKWVERIESTRSVKIPQAGDRILYTSPHGDYFDKAVIKKSNKMELIICIHPQTSFVMESNNDIQCMVYGNVFVRIPLNKSVYIGNTGTIFESRDHPDVCKNGSFRFEAQVSLWEYVDSNPLYGNFTTKTWRKLYFYKSDEKQMSKPGYIHSSDNQITYKTEEEFSEFLKLFNATVFHDEWPNPVVVWCYKDQFINITQKEWDQLDRPVLRRQIHNQMNQVKIQYDDDSHTLNSYYVNKHYKIDPSK